MAGKPGLRHKQPVSPASLRDMSERLKTASKALASLASDMEERDMDSMEVLGTAMVDRGFKAFRSFVGNCQKELQDF